MLAIEKNDLGFVKNMVERGANPFVQNKKAIGLAEEFGKLDIAKYLASYIQEKRAKVGMKTPDAQACLGWSIISGTTAEYTGPSGASGISLTYNINFDTETVTTLPQKDGMLGTPIQQQFNFFQKRTMIATAHEKISKRGHRLKHLSEIFALVQVIGLQNHWKCR